MKRLMVEQTGYVQVDVHRKFLVEVPDDCDKEQAMELLAEMESHTHLEGAEWADEDGRLWIGYDLEFVDTHVDDAEGPVGIEVLRLGVVQPS